MDQARSTGVYILNPGGNGNDFAFYKRLESFVKTLPGVLVVWDSQTHDHCDSCISASIKKLDISRMVLIGDKPGVLKPYFSQVLSESGYNGDSVRLISFKESGIDYQDYDHATELLLKVFNDKKSSVGPYEGKQKAHHDTLVIGGGIAGIQASLEIANAGEQVYLVEKQGTIGGHMAMFDKTFPTLDCAACILTPKMVDVSQHPKIDLLSYSEVKSVEGVPGDFKVRIVKKARFVSEDLCIGCGSCSAKCPGKAPSEFDVGTTLRKAIYIPFPQAVPNKYLIDKESCNYMLTNGEKCGVCVKFCPVNDCIDLHQKDEEIEVNVGNIILATGFEPFDASRIERYGYGKYPNVLTSLELERLINAGGPTEGKITLRSQDKKGNWVFNKDSKQPKSIALIHCIGSRDENFNKYCSRVCCMYSLKLAHLVQEKIPDANVLEYFIDMRAFGKGYEEFYQRIIHEGVHMIRGKTANINQQGDKLVLRSEDILNDRLIEQQVDMVVLAVGLEPNKDAKHLAGLLGIKQSCEGWYTEKDYLSDPIATQVPNILIAGVCQGPKDIPDTVAQASSAAARVLQSIASFSEVES